MIRDWTRGEFAVCDGEGERETEAGIVRGAFGIFSLGGDGRSASWSYLIHIPTGQPLALFADEALAMSAANVLEPLDDWSADILADVASGTAALVGAGFYTTGQHDGPSHVWDRPAARSA